MADEVEVVVTQRKDLPEGKALKMLAKFLKKNEAKPQDEQVGGTWVVWNHGRGPGLSVGQDCAAGLRM